MATYFLSYDLRKKRDYKTLYEELNKYKAIMILESLYCFKRKDTNAIYLKNHFKKFIDSDDGLIVIESKGWASRKIKGNPNKL